MKKIYMAGSGGMLGLAFYEEFKENYVLKCSDIDVNEDWLTYLDFRNYQTYLEQVKSFEPHWLFHLGAHTDLEFCELNEKDAYETNTKSVEHAVSISNELGIPLLYISTAGIFGGEKDFYDEKSVMINFKYEQDTLDLKRDAFKRYGDTVSGIVKCIQRTGGAQYFHRKAVTV